jgi:hypothetical protein
VSRDPLKRLEVGLKLELDPSPHPHNRNRKTYPEIHLPFIHAIFLPYIWDYFSPLFLKLFSILKYWLTLSLVFDLAVCTFLSLDVFYLS